MDLMDLVGGICTGTIGIQEPIEGPKNPRIRYSQAFPGGSEESAILGRGTVLSASRDRRRSQESAILGRWAAAGADGN